MLKLHGQWHWGWIYSKSLYKLTNWSENSWGGFIHIAIKKSLILLYFEMIFYQGSATALDSQEVPFHSMWHFPKWLFHLSEVKEFNIIYNLVFSSSQKFFFLLLIHYRHILDFVSQHWSLFNVGSPVYAAVSVPHTIRSGLCTFLQHQFYPLSADPPGTGASWELPCCWLADRQEVEDDQDLKNQSEPRISTDPSCSQHLPVENTDKTKPMRRKINWRYTIILTFQSEVRSV